MILIWQGYTHFVILSAAKDLADRSTRAALLA